MFSRVAGPVHPVHEEDVRPAVVVVIDESNARSERLRQIFFSKRAIVVDKVNSGLLRDVTKRHARRTRGSWCARSRKCRKKQSHREHQKNRSRLLHFATAFPSRPTPRASATRLM